MSWITLDTDSLYTGKAAPLIDQLREAALANGQSDPAPAVIQSVVDRVRAEIASCRNNRVDADAATVPASLRSLTLRLIVWEMQSRVNVFNAVAPSEQDVIDHRDDLAYLRRIASCDVVVEDALVEGAVQQGGAVQVVSAPVRQASREKMRGL
jgi:hypothetical protein